MLGDSESDALALGLRDPLGLIEALGELDTELEGLTELDGETELDGDRDTEADDDGDNEADADALGLCDGEAEPNGTAGVTVAFALSGAHIRVNRMRPAVSVAEAIVAITSLVIIFSVDTLDSSSV